jgi:GTP-binding protein
MMTDFQQTIPNPYAQAQFLKSAARVEQLPSDTGYEVAFAGRSNAGKSSALNCLTGIRRLARTSKTPGRTQLINVFTLQDPARRLIDLPGYGYAKVPQKIKMEWQRHLADYLHVRQSLCGLILLMDIRHPLKDSDRMMVAWAIDRALPVHILLTKADKLSRGQASNTVLDVQRSSLFAGKGVTVQAFSALKRQGVSTLIEQLNSWFDFE